MANSLIDWFVASGLDRVVLEETNAVVAVFNEINLEGGIKSVFLGILAKPH